MLPITQYYRDVFVKSYESGPDSAVVDISALIEESKIRTPLPLPYNNKSETLRNLPAAVIIDFCNLHRAYKLLPTNLIRAMTAVILGDTDDIVAARIFVSHIVQSDIDLDYFSYLIMQADSIRIKSVLEEDERKWIDMSKKVLEHKQINEAINECLKDFNENPSADDDELKLNSIGVNLICSDDVYLRGFVGIGEIFININHFRKKIDDFKGDGDLLELIAKMDIISVTILELAQLRFRQCRNDFHIPTPMTAQQVGLGKSTFEFGAYVERKLFNKQVDWFKSKFTLDVQYMERFITGIEEQTTLPTGFIQGALPRAEVKQIDGLDIGSEAYLC